MLKNFTKNLLKRNLTLKKVCKKNSYYLIIPVLGEDAFPYKYLLIRPAKKDCLPAITAFLKARAISYGFFALAIAVLTKTPSQPSSIAIVASYAWPKPASMIRGNLV